MEQLWLEWTEVHASLGRYFETITSAELSQMAFKHPIMGPTPVRGMLPFLLQHFKHHMRQVGRIRASPAFPRA